jgi:hypothetical protein
METGMVLASEGTNQASDSPHLAPMLGSVIGAAGFPEKLAAEAG